jgi:hypothetical protein
MGQLCRLRYQSPRWTDSLNAQIAGKRRSAVSAISRGRKSDRHHCQLPLAPPESARNR